MSHLDDGLIQELLDGEVPSAELPPIQAHLAACAACRARLEEARDFASASDEMIGWLDEPTGEATPAPVAPDIAPRRAPASWPRNVAWAASLMLAVGLGYTARGGSVPPASNGTPAPVTSAPSAEFAPSTSEEQLGDQANRASGTASVISTPERTAANAPRPSTATPVERQVTEPTGPELGQTLGRRVEADASRQAPEREAAPPAAPLAESRRERADAAPVDNRLAPPAMSAAGAARTLVARDQAAAKATQAQATIDTVGTPAGTLFRIDGLELLRSTVAQDVVRLVYAHPDGEVTLVQRRVGTQLAWHLEAAAEFPAAVLHELKRRVK